MKIKLADSKLVALALAIIVSVIYMTNITTEVIDDNTVSFVSIMQSNDVMSHLMEDLQLLLDTVNVIAQKDEIQQTLVDVKNNGYTQQYGDTLKDIVANFNDIIISLSFVEKITVISIADQFFISDNEHGTNYDVYSRPWLTEEIEKSQTAVATAQYTQWESDDISLFSIVRFIYDPETQEPLGAISLDIYLDSLIEKLKQSYAIADLDIIIHADDGTSYSSNKQIGTEINDITKYYAGKNVEIINYTDEGNMGITFIVDLDSIKENPEVAANSSNTITRIILLILCIAIIITISLIILLKPVSKALDSLVHIIEELGDNSYEYKTGISRMGELAKHIEDKLPKKIRQLLYYDELTNLPNRKMVKLYYQKFNDAGEPFLIMLLDIKNFKGVNDAVGDVTGDFVLQAVATKLNNSVSHERGVVIRYSGDEFIIMVPHTDRDVQHCYKKQILDTFNSPLLYPNKKPIYIEFNAAGISCPLQCNTEEDMITKIYVMIKHAKDLNTSGILLFNQAIYSTYIKEERIKELLGTAVGLSEFVIYYQPIIDGDRHIKKAEALIRWFSGELGFVPPNEFIFIAEQTRMIILLGNWIIERVAKDIRLLLDCGHEMQISINISPIQMMEDDFVTNALAILDRYCIEYKYVCFEITESVLLEDKEIVRKNLAELKRVGIDVALDDFGTGYSSFSYLQEYKLDIIKIDKIFVDNAKDYSIIDGITRISNSLEMQTIIEGVETQEQFDALKQFGLIQGYYFSRPVVFEEFKKLLHS